MNGGTVTAIAGALAVIAVAFVTGLWQFLSGRKKTIIDAQGALVSGFIALLAEFKDERSLMITRINELEDNNQKQDRRISKLERIMSKHNIAIPENGT